MKDSCKKVELILDTGLPKNLELDSLGKKLELWKKKYLKPEILNNFYM